MMRIIPICFIACLVCASPSGADECARYADDASGYSVCLPPGWAPAFTDGEARRLDIRAPRGAAEISVSASTFGDREQKIWDGFRQWRTVEIGRRVMKIIETEEQRAADEVLFKLLLFEYTGRKGRMLQRSLLVKYGGRLLVVECRAPVGTFARHSAAFNRAMSSVEFTGAPRGEKVERFAKAERSADAAPARDKDRLSERETVPDGETTPDGGGTTEAPTGGEAKKVEIDPDTMKIIEKELEKLQLLEEKGIIERVEGE